LVLNFLNRKVLGRLITYINRLSRAREPLI
jgi:hypothetical protein